MSGREQDGFNGGPRPRLPASAPVAIIAGFVSRTFS
jgi:hypothetical protein